MKDQFMLQNIKKISVQNLNYRQKKTYNFQKVSSLFADYGFATYQVNDAWQNVDFIASHLDGVTCLSIYIKDRLTFHEKYLHQEIYICFPHKENWYLFPHDKLLRIFLEKNVSGIANSKSWTETGSYSFSKLSKQNYIILENFKL